MMLPVSNLRGRDEQVADDEDDWDSADDDEAPPPPPNDKDENGTPATADEAVQTSPSDPTVVS